MAETITLADLKSAFSTYIGTNQKDILRLLTQPTVSETFMTTVASQDLVYRAAKALIDDLVQGFQKAWTPKGTAKFTPISIVQRRHKIDLAFYPDEIMDSWLGFLGDEATDRKAWPISKYIIEQLILPKVLENRELKLVGRGAYASPVDGTAQAVGLSMDGFLTILTAKKAAGTSLINFITLSVLTEANIFDQVELFAKSISEIYINLSMNIYISRAWYAAYHRKRRDLHGQDTNYTGAKDLIEGTNLILVPLPSMAASNIIFATPKENFIRLMNRNNGASNITVESVDRQIKVFADWYESVGFGIEEAVFASVPIITGSPYQDQDPPDAPVVGTHIAAATQIIWKWQDVEGATGYKWGTINNNANATDMETAITHTETGLTANTVYTRYAWAYNVYGNSIALTMTQSTAHAT